MTTRILFVCLGNICRSPTAEGVVRAKAATAGLSLSLDSCGTGGWHAGDPPYGPMQTAARARGYDLSDLRARQLHPADFTDFDLILAMDRANLSDIRAMAPTGATAVLALFLDGLEPEEVPDPYYTRDFDEALDLVEIGAERLLKRLERRTENLQRRFSERQDK